MKMVSLKLCNSEKIWKTGVRGACENCRPTHTMLTFSHPHANLQLHPHLQTNILFEMVICFLISSRLILSHSLLSLSFSFYLIGVEDWFLRCFFLVLLWSKFLVVVFY